MKNLVLDRFDLLGVVSNYAQHRASLLLLLLPLLLNSCSLSLFPGYHRQAETDAVAPASWFQSDSSHFLFNTKIDLMKDHFSGLMVVKPFPDSSYRVVFLTEVGLKIFDLEFMPDRQVKVHYMMDAMNRKALVNTLSNDISLVLMNGLQRLQPEVLGLKDSHDLVFRFKIGSRKNCYYVASQNNRPYLARQVAGISRKVTADLYGNPHAGIDSVKIKHDNLRLAISLYRIIENPHAAE